MRNQTLIIKLDIEVVSRHEGLVRPELEVPGEGVNGRALDVVEHVELVVVVVVALGVFYQLEAYITERN